SSRALEPKPHVAFCLAPTLDSSLFLMRQKYLDLVKAANRLTTNDQSLPVLRLAILGDHATQQLARVIRAALHQRGVWAEIYEAEYDSLQAEILNPESGLYAFAPDYVWLSLCSQQYMRRHGNTPAEELADLPARWAGEVAGLVKALAAKRSQIIINNLAPLRERLFGNYAVRTASSPYGSALEANRALAAAAGSASQCYINDVAYLASRSGLESWYDDRWWIHSKYPCAPEHFAAIAESAASIIMATRGKLTKVVALDLDNTLWGGVIGDDGLEGIEIGGMGAGEAFEEFQRYLLRLKQRGLILAICSKNDEANARLPFREHPAMVLKETDIAAFVANWSPKSENLRRIARLLNLGLDSIVFVDDSPFERNEVRMAVPEVRVPEMPEEPAQFAAALDAAGHFEATAFTEDDQRRSDMYREEFARADLREQATNIDDYLRSLNMKMTCRPLDGVSVQRVAQLMQRSNQFNLRTQRYSEARCREFIAAAEQFPAFHFHLRDKFGDYGLISAVCCEVVDSKLEIREWVMSCRVLNRGAEERIMGCIARAALTRGLARLGGEYLATTKNGMVRELYHRLGFSLEEEGAAGTRWTLMLDQYVEPPSHIELE
ncbi:MAG TPA: HAD-IIIC family phosphatase, partial [Chthoniobacteraceae bacterium]